MVAPFTRDMDMVKTKLSTVVNYDKSSLEAGLQVKISRNTESKKCVAKILLKMMLRCLELVRMMPSLLKVKVNQR